MTFEPPNRFIIGALLVGNTLGMTWKDTADSSTLFLNISCSISFEHQLLRFVFVFGSQRFTVTATIDAKIHPERTVSFGAAIYVLSYFSPPSSLARVALPASDEHIFRDKEYVA